MSSNNNDKKQASRHRFRRQPKPKMFFGRAEMSLTPGHYINLNSGQRLQFVREQHQGMKAIINYHDVISYHLSDIKVDKCSPCPLWSS